MVEIRKIIQGRLLYAGVPFLWVHIPVCVISVQGGLPMQEYILEIKQTVDYPRCRIYRGFVQTLIADKDLRTNGKAGAFYPARPSGSPPDPVFYVGKGYRREVSHP